MPVRSNGPYIPARVAVWTAFSALLLPLIGCTLGPNYQRAAVPTPPAYKEPPPAGWKDATPHDEISKGDWWQVFGDPQLNDLEMQAMAANQTLQAAVQRVLESRASLAVTRSQQYPQVSAQPSLAGTREGGARPLPPGSPSVSFTEYELTLPADVTYEVD